MKGVQFTQGIRKGYLFYQKCYIKLKRVRVLFLGQSRVVELFTVRITTSDFLKTKVSRHSFKLKFKHDLQEKQRSLF